MQPLPNSINPSLSKPAGASPRLRANLRLRGGPSSLLALLLISMVLLCSWSFVVPIFEAPDEPAHWHYVLYLHDNLRLPVYSRGLLEEANSPPLYYMLMAPFAAASDLPKGLWWIDAQGVIRSPAGPERFQTSKSDLTKYWPLRRVRLLTALFSVGTVLFCYLAGVEATGKETTGLLAGGLTALLPQFTFRGMSISNDALVTTLSAVTVYLIVRLIRRGFTWPVGLATGVAMALAFLTKPTALFLPIPFALVVLSEKTTWRARVGRLGILSLTLGLVAPWLIRNQVLYGDPLASRAMLTVVPHLIDPKPITSPYFVTTFPVLLTRSFIGLFGWMSLGLPAWIYELFGFLDVAALLGYVWGVLRDQIDKRLTLILVTMPILSLFITIYINLTITQPQGRYLFPALPAMAVLAALGLESLPGWSRRVTWVLLGGLILLNIYIQAAVVIPAYWRALATIVFSGTV